MENKPTVKTAILLPEGVYKVAGAYSCQASKHATSPQRVFKSSYARVNSVRITSPSPKAKSKLGFTKKPVPVPVQPPPAAATGQGVDFFVYPSSDCLCVCSVNALDQDAPPREKRFSSDPTCCAINAGTSSAENLETLVGFESGEILLIDAITFSQSGKFNGSGTLNNSRVTDIKWLPGSVNTFVATFGNGVMLVFDKEKDDANAKNASAQATPPDLSGSGGDGSFSVLHPKTSRNNPMSRWHAGKGPINHVCFSTDTPVKMALCCQDGHCRVFDLAQEKLLASFRSQYGAMLCAAWSPDNHYLITGGEDDTLIVWSMEDKCAVARCLGHNSWISAVQFDPEFCEDDESGDGPGSNYRFLSVAQDGRLCFWDLNEGNLIFSRKRPGIPRKSISASPVRQLGHVVEVPLPEEIASMEPTANILIDLEPLSTLHVTNSSLVTACFGGEAKLWSKPGTLSDGHE
mmetsp:Transcript_5867/g.11622  ORF Transcript_5867/g.11622 Transcript_5867/m.11622 type:complete len:461 (-) Transcript_5867:20-1402(-)|eukprot:CAMPEP_0181319220 /NCGR_PEP_ID=MMETSP1101-20121128/17448_1 /TAXON_ID=46948 /ORGANISM="Rhodomonas abbreviata, Strain Caron Lab Isolate" /LENGTH=460 /DNA_ID=CAMNT_0023426791 /DNA_START=348 /DNA_END=1730 /DNA_ORIENTATION=-